MFNGSFLFSLASISFLSCSEDVIIFHESQELREINAAEAVKGKYFFLETDMKGSSLKLDNTGKAILTVSGSLKSPKMVLSKM